MKKFKIALIISLIAALLVAMPVFATEGSSDDSQVQSKDSGEEVQLTDEELEALLSSQTDGQEPINTTSMQLESFSGNTKRVNVKEFNIKIDALEELTVFSPSSPNSVLAQLNLTQETFIDSWALILLSDNSDLFASVRCYKNAYTKSVGSYSLLSRIEKEALITEKEQANENGLENHKVELVKYAGMTCIKESGVATEYSSNLVIFKGLKNGYMYEIVYQYATSLDEQTINKITDMVNSLKLAPIFELEQILLYVALLFILLLIAVSILLFVKFVKLSKIVKNRTSDDNNLNEEITDPTDEETSADDFFSDEEEEMDDDSVFANPEENKDEYIEDAVEETKETEE